MVYVAEKGSSTKGRDRKERQGRRFEKGRSVLTCSSTRSNSRPDTLESFESEEGNHAWG